MLLALNYVSATLPSGDDTRDINGHIRIPSAFVSDGFLMWSHSPTHNPLSFTSRYVALSHI